jgi:muconate cycloisomerase
MHAPRVVRIELTPLHVPFRPAVREAMGGSPGGLGMAIPAEEPWLGGDFVICRITADDGSQGLGEAFVWLPETGVSPGQLVATAADALAPYLLGESPFDVVRIARRMDDNVARSDVAKGLLDMACYDLMGHITGRLAHDFMGGRCADALPLAALIPLLEPKAMAEMAAAYVAGGSKTVRLKLGVGVEGDRETVAAVRDAVGPGVRLRVDYNRPTPRIRPSARSAPSRNSGSTAPSSRFVPATRSEWSASSSA